MSFWSRILFFVIFFSIIFLLHYLVFRTFRKFIKSQFPDSKLLKVISLYPFIIFNLPYIYIMINRFNSGTFPIWIYNSIFIPFYIFQGAVLFIGLYLLIGKIIKAPFLILTWISFKFKETKILLQKFFRKPAVKKIDKSRRAFVRTSAALVSGYAFVGSTLGVLDSDDYEIVNRDIKIENLPQEIKGTTITLVCDIHSGPYMKEDLMREYVDVINNLKSDFIMIPGDITNSNKIEVTPFVNAFKNLKADKGIYASLGNHDYFSDANYVAHVISNESPIKMLRNDSDIINIGGKDLCIIGIEDTRQSGAAYDTILMNYLEETLKKTQSKVSAKNLDYTTIPKIALFHKPYMFESLKDKNLDLTLSGHTHGGQVVLAKFGSMNISFAGAVSKYISGLYEIGKSKMYVSRGIGSVALPIRFNCPPEITKITLV